MSDAAINDKVWDKQSVLDLINGSNKACGRALYGLYQRQTADEKASETTRDHNGRGFNGRDAEFLSSIAKRLPDYGYTMTLRQLPHVRRKLRKYTRQLLEIIEEKGGRVSFKNGEPQPAQLPLIAPEIAATAFQAPVADVSSNYGIF